jgi:hypothetical protein
MKDKFVKTFETFTPVIDQLDGDKIIGIFKYKGNDFKINNCSVSIGWKAFDFVYDISISLAKYKSINKEGKGVDYTHLYEIRSNSETGETKIYDSSVDKTLEIDLETASNVQKMYSDIIPNGDYDELNTFNTSYTPDDMITYKY